MGDARTRLVKLAQELERQHAALVQAEVALRQVREELPGLGVGLPTLERVRRMLRGAEQLSNSAGVEVADVLAELGPQPPAEKLAG